MKKKDCLLKGQDAIEEVRRILYDNEEGLKILDRLVEGGRLSRKNDKICKLLFALGILLLFVSVGLAREVLSLPEWSAIVLGIINASPFLIAVVISNNYIEEEYYGEFTFVNQLLVDLQKNNYEDLPVLKTNENYYIYQNGHLIIVGDETDGVAETNLDTPIFVRRYSYNMLQWDKNDFVLKEEHRKCLFMNSENH